MNFDLHIAEMVLHGEDSSLVRVGSEVDLTDGEGMVGAQPCTHAIARQSMMTEMIMTRILLAQM